MSIENTVIPMNVHSQIILASGLMSASVAVLSWSLSRIATISRPNASSYFERVRREGLRESNRLYRIFEPLIDELRFLQQGRKADELQKCFDEGQAGPPWSATDYLSVKLIEACLVGVVIACVLSPIAGIAPGLFVAAIIGYFMYSLAVNAPLKKRARRIQRIKRRLPFALDLIALMMKAGSQFSEAVESVANESSDHPLGHEFHRLNQDIQRGKTRRQSLEELRIRVDDDDVREIVFAINKSEELGTPLADTVQSLADELRLKRSQWAEKAAARAQVQIVFPGLIVMVACLMIVVALFVLPLLRQQG